ncbi:MAG: diadenylate cyclase [Zetaproteobacteria bacterium]|nr:MAG: diadenylate cyclase [Zetaproteobacteria bacterium]
MNSWSFGLRDAIDILCVAVVVYFLLRMIRGTRAMQMLMGLGIVVAVYFLARHFGLFTVEWIFGHFFSAFIVILVVLFQHEIRRALVRVAFNPLVASEDAARSLAHMLMESAVALVERGWGGLIVVERETGLRHLYETGVELDTPLSPDLVLALFCPQAPMHDGAIIVRQTEQGGRIRAARVLLPLAQAKDVPGALGTRHRAAIGLSEEADALVIVVSEERRDIHLVREGHIEGPLDGLELHRRLMQCFQPDIDHHTVITMVRGKGQEAGK